MSASTGFDVNHIGAPAKRVGVFLQGHRMLIVVVLLGTLIPGCASVKGDYERARRTDTIEAYQEFVAQNPGSEFENAVNQRIESLKEEERRKEEERIRREKEEEEAWQRAREANSIGSLAEYLNQYQDMKNNEVAWKQLVELVRRSAPRDTVSGDPVFLSVDDFPNDLFSVEDVVSGSQRLYTAASTRTDEQYGIANYLTNGLVQWHSLYDEKTQLVYGIGTGYANFAARIVPVAVKIASSRAPGTSVTLIRGLGYTADDIVGHCIFMWLTVYYESKEVVDREMTLNGVGLAILESTEGVKFYEFIDGDGTSIFD